MSKKNKSGEKFTVVMADPQKANLIANCIVDALQVFTTEEGFSASDVAFGIAMSLAIHTRISCMAHSSAVNMLQKCLAAPMFEVPAQPPKARGSA